MAIDVRCSCGFSGSLPDEFRGQQALCPKCGTVLTPGAPAGSAPVAAPSPAPVAPNMQACPYCSEQIPLAAYQCPRCHENLAAPPKAAPPPPLAEGGFEEAQEARRVATLDAEGDEDGRTAFKLGLLGFLCCPIVAPFAFIKGLSAYSKSNRAGSTNGYAIAGIVFGGLGTLGLITHIVMGATGSFSGLMAKSKEEGRQVCRGRVAKLHIAMRQYVDQTGESPVETGGDLWLALSRQGRLDAGDMVCPETGAAPAEGMCQYRGPGLPLYELSATSPIACDRPGNHKDGSIHVLYMDGRVQLLSKDHPDYRATVDSLND
jgi:hypothetical protein